MPSALPGVDGLGDRLVVSLHPALAGDRLAHRLEERRSLAAPLPLRPFWRRPCLARLPQLVGTCLLHLHLSGPFVQLAPRSRPLDHEQRGQKHLRIVGEAGLRLIPLHGLPLGLRGLELLCCHHGARPVSFGPGQAKSVTAGVRSHWGLTYLS